MVIIKWHVGFKNAEGIYERSLMVRDYPSLKFSYRRVSTLLELGRIEKAKDFQERCFGKTDAMALDSHVIPKKSVGNDLVAAGFKTK